MRRLFTLTIFNFFLIYGTFGQNHHQYRASIFDIMNYSEVLEMTLETNISTLKDNRRSEDKQKGILRFEDANGQKQTWEIKAALRGRFRRLNCEMPPLKLDFKKSALSEAGLTKWDDIKLVTNCVPDKNEAKTLILKEYLAYQLYNQISPNSYRTQLVKVTYIDTATGKKEKQWGFLIEDTAQLEARMKAEKVESFGHDYKDFDAPTVENVAIFQYLIGNTDWKLNIGHNLKFFKQNGKIIAVPYDFDFSGLVNAPYAIPNPDYDLISVQERMLPDLPAEFQDWHDTVYFFQGKKEELLKVVKNLKILNKEHRDEVTTYLNSYLNNVTDVKVYTEKEASGASQLGK